MHSCLIAFDRSYSKKYSLFVLSLDNILSFPSHNHLSFDGSCSFWEILSIPDQVFSGLIDDYLWHSRDVSNIPTWHYYGDYCISGVWEKACSFACLTSTLEYSFPTVCVKTLEVTSAYIFWVICMILQFWQKIWVQYVRASTLIIKVPWCMHQGSRPDMWYIQ